MRLFLMSGLLAATLQPALATELTHRFINPQFGGNALNSSFLLNQADGQNTHKEAVAPVTQKSQIEQFKESLQRAILNQVSRSTTQALFDDNGNIVLGSDLKFDLDGDGNSDFSVLVNSQTNNGSVTINITDGITDTSLTVPYSTNTK